MNETHLLVRRQKLTPSGSDLKTARLTFPREILSIFAKYHGMGIKSFLREFELEITFGGFNDCHFTFVSKEYNHPPKDKP